MKTTRLLCYSFLTLLGTLFLVAFLDAHSHVQLGRAPETGLRLAGLEDARFALRRWTALEYLCLVAFVVTLAVPLTIRTLPTRWKDPTLSWTVCGMGLLNCGYSIAAEGLGGLATSGALVILMIAVLVGSRASRRRVEAHPPA